MSRLVVALLLAGCATAPPPRKVSFEEASRLVTTAPQQTLDAALTHFAEATKGFRAQATPGARMTPPHVGAWSDLLEATERFAQVKSPTWLLDAMRARVQLEGELHTDARLFGDIPLEVAERVPLALSVLSQRIAARTPRVRRVDPRAFRWPVSPLIVSSPYGSRVHPIAGELRFHAGVDLEAPLEHPIVAAETGTVVFADWNGGHGYQVELQHDAHWATRYSHLEKLLVAPGTAVKKGQVIGLAGATGVATGPHLHFELRRDGDALDPEAFLRGPSLPAPLLSVAP